MKSVLKKQLSVRRTKQIHKTDIQKQGNIWESAKISGMAIYKIN